MVKGKQVFHVLHIMSMHKIHDTKLRDLKIFNLDEKTLYCRLCRVLLEDLVAQAAAEH